MLTVAKLRAYLSSLPPDADNALVVISAPDHEYQTAAVSLGTALTRADSDPTNPKIPPRKHWMYEDYGDESKLHPDDNRIPVLMVG